MVPPIATRRSFLRGTALTGLCAVGVPATTTATTDSESTIVVDGSPETGATQYEFTVSGEITGKRTTDGASKNPNDTIDTDTATGEVWNGKDAYGFTGDVTSFTADGYPHISIDGTLRQDLLDTYSNHIVIESTALETVTQYDIEVSDAIEKSTVGTASLNSRDTISGTTASGFVVRGTDAYAYAGDLRRVNVDANVAVRVNGAPLHVVTIAKDDAAESVSYSLSVDGDLAKSTAGGASINADDIVSGQTVEGQVYAGIDCYAFTGSITDLSSDGGLTVQVDGKTQGYTGSWPPTAAEYAELEHAVHKNVNTRRDTHGLGSLSYSSELAAAARKHSQDMIAQDYFGHVAPGDSSFADHYTDEGIECQALGENILYRTITGATVEDIAGNIVEQWMNSSGHRENLLSSEWGVEGIGIAVTEDDVLYATQAFGYNCQ